MVLSNFPVTVPPDGYVDNPKEMEELLSESRLQLNYRDVRNLAVREDTTSSAQIDDLLSRELLEMSLQDRNAITEEIHGVQTLAPEETPEKLATALRDLQTEINKIPSKVAFDRSQEFPNTYVNSPEFRLRFLRCDLFEVKKAASRMVIFLDILSELFGDFALRRQVQMSDFSREEMQVFRIGYQQLLPYRDRSGRRIFASVGGFGMGAPLVTRVSLLQLYSSLV